MGWPDEEFAANGVKARREGVGEFARFVGFES